ncbi:hypothetical protein N665_0170s0018 [Sinapis alba]|nr:hypothetical protein N665_0170s0018 [Sinapis alba]
MMRLITDHLIDIYKILKLWKALESVSLCGLFHSAYSNSYVNLAIFHPSTGRDVVHEHVGEAAESLIHLLGGFDGRGSGGRRFVAFMKLILDKELDHQRKIVSFWLSCFREMTLEVPPDTWLYTLISSRKYGALEFIGTHVMEQVLDAKEQIEARDMYWEAVSSDASKEGYLERAEERLLGCIEKNPFVGEPHVLLSQVYLGKKMFVEAEREAERGLLLLLQWGSPWNKRMSWEGWIAWVRVLLMKSHDQMFFS